MKLFFTQFRRDLLVAVRSRSDAANPLAFFVLATVLLGLGTGAELAPGVIWVLAVVRQRAGRGRGLPARPR